MSTINMFVGCQHDVENLKSLNDRLNTKVVEQINSSQELVMLNNFAQETNEYLLKRSLEERMSDIASWRWVFVDLGKRLQEAIATLHHERNTLVVVVQRIQSEIDGHSGEASRPGALTPFSDSVEEAIIQEQKFLRDQRKKFEIMIPELDRQIEALTKTNKRIEVDILNKQEALSIDESCINVDPNSTRIGNVKKRNRRASLLVRWEKRCQNVKTAGLRALCNAITIRQQVRGARVHLSIAAQAYAAKVDSALRRRLHANKITMQDLNWQKDEAIRDYKALEEELNTTEQNILETMQQERIVEARLADRNFRPQGERTRDNVDRKLRDELGRLKCFSKHLRNNYERIRTLQHSLTDCISRVSCCAEDTLHVVELDEERIRFRVGEEPQSSLPSASSQDSSTRRNASGTNCRGNDDVPLSSIIEEDEDDYPFDD